MKEVIGVRFRENGKIYFFNPLNYKIDPGRYVIVETQHGVEYGKVVLGRREVDETKLQGEKAVINNTDKYFIVRIAWVFGVNGSNFVKTMLRLGKTHSKLTVVDDQIGTPTYTYDLARLWVDMIESEKYGYYHATNEGGFISWCDFAKEIFKQAGYTTQVQGVTTEQYGASKAKRPLNSRLDKSKLAENGFEPLPDWKDALSRYLKQIDY